MAESAVQVAEEWNTRALSLGRMAVCSSGDGMETTSNRWRIAAPLENGTDIGIFDGTGTLCTTVSPTPSTAGGLMTRTGGMAMACSWLDGSNKLSVAYDDGLVRCYDTAASGSTCLFTYTPSKETQTCTALCCMAQHSPDNMETSWRCVLGTAGSHVSVFDVDSSGSHPTEQADITLQREGVSDIAVRRYDGKVFATAGWDHRVRLFALGCGTHSKIRPLAVLRFHSESVTSVDFGPRDGLLASGSRDTRIALWKLY